MADWNLAFDYAAGFFMLLILLWYVNDKKIPLRSHRAFLILVVNAYVSTVLEVAATLMARNMETVGYNGFFVVMTLQNLAMNVLPITFTFYILQLAHIDIFRNRKLHNFFKYSIWAHVIICALNFKFHWFFVFEDGLFQVKPAGFLEYVIDGLMLTLCAQVLVKSKRRFLYIKMIPLLFTIVCTIGAAVLQLRFYIPALNLMQATICMTLYYYQQNAGMVTDVVTKQFNRRFMGEYLRSKYLEHREFAVIVIAMDDFKFVNKTYGVETGDNLLYQVGNYLEKLDVYQTVFRFGSDQFCIVLNKKVKNMGEVAEMIQERFHHPWYSETQTAIMMSASICCIECPREAENYGELIEVMDYSMTLAKKTRRGRITKASEIELDKIRQEKAIEKAIKEAIDKDELQVYYQPIFSVSKGVYNSAEALVRLHNDELGWISPEDFIPIAEKNGLILEMGEMILEKVCRFIRDFKLSETTVEYIEVNISPVQLIQLNFADRVKHILEKYGVKPEQINIEITETATMNSVATVNSNINELVNYGISFSLDDYGSGNANIDYINKMPFKIIKIDKFIIWDSFKNSKAGITLEYTIGMLNALELYIVAEGVENEEMKQRLADFGCHYMQGWYYSKAVPENEFMQLLGAQ